MHIRKARAGSVPGYTWNRDGEVVEVDDRLAEQLLLIPGGAFSIAEAPEVPEPETAEPIDESSEKSEPAGVEEDPETESKKSPGRPKLPRDGKGNIIRN